MSAPHSTIGSLQGLVDDLIRTFDQRPTWKLKGIRGATSQNKTVADLVDLLGDNARFVDTEQPLRLGDMFAITEDHAGVLGIVFGAETARYFADVTNLLIRITELLQPALEEARKLRLGIIAAGEDVLACRTSIKQVVSTHEAMRRAARAVLEADPVRQLQGPSPHGART